MEAAAEAAAAVEVAPAEPAGVVGRAVLAADLALVGQAGPTAVSEPVLALAWA